MLRAARIALVLFAAVAGFLQLGRGSLRDWDESLTAGRAREMLVGGDWLTPRLAGQPDFNKPPLYYALTTLALRVRAGEEASVRFWSVVFALGCLFFCERTATRLGGSGWTGLLAAFLLAANAHWVNRTREGLLDSGVLFGLLAGLYFLLPAPGAATARRAVLAGLCIAAGTLIKHPLPALALPVALLLGARRRDVAIAAGLFVVAGLSWYAAMWIRWGDDFTDNFIRYNLVGRATVALDMRPSPRSYYLVEWFHKAPFSLLLFAGAIVTFVVHVLTRRRVEVRSAAGGFQSLEKGSPATSNHWKKSSGILLGVALGLLVVLSLMASRRDVYLLFVYPPAAIATALCLSRMLRRRDNAFIAAAAVAAFGLLEFTRHYVPVIDGNPALKEIALQLRAAAPQDAVVLAGQLPVATIMFYSERHVLFTWQRPVAEVLQTAASRPDAPLFVVVRRRAAPAMREELAALAPPGFAPRLAGQNKVYAIVALDRRMP